MNSDGIHIIEITEIVEVTTSGDVRDNVDKTDSTNTETRPESASSDPASTIEVQEVTKPKVAITTRQVGNIVLVVITSDYKDAEIVYKINNDKSVVYQNEFSVSENCKITAVAKCKGVASDYVDVVIDSFVVAKPSIIAENKIVTINSSTPNSDIYYTLDGKEPTRNSTFYKGEFTIKNLVR